MSFLGDLSPQQGLANMNANLAQNTAMNQGAQFAAQQQQASIAAQQAQLANIYGPQGFGGQTAYYAGLGADYGRATGGFGGYGAPNADPFSLVGGGGYPSGVVTSAPMPGYQLDPTPGVGGGGSAWGGSGSGWAFDDYGNPYMRGAGPSGGGVDFPQAPPSAPPPVPQGQVDWGAYFSGLTAPAAAQPAYNPFAQYGSGGYNPFSPSSYAPAAQQNLGGGYPSSAYSQGPSPTGGGSGGWSFDDQGNPFQSGVGPTTSGLSNAPAYQGNPFYMPQPMQGGSPFQGGGGLGAWGFGIGQPQYTGQPGFGMGIGAVNGPVSMSPAFGAMPGTPPFSGQPGYGFGGLGEGYMPQDVSVGSSAGG